MTDHYRPHHSGRDGYRIRFALPREPRRDDRYQDSRNDRYDHYGGRSRSRTPPLRSHEMRRFGADSYSANGVNGHHDRNEFSFRGDQQLQAGDGRPPTEPRARRLPGKSNHGFRGGRQGHQNGRPQNGRRFGPKPAHERQILHHNEGRATTPERLSGMVDAAAKFKEMEDWGNESESDDDAMDLESPTEEDASMATKRLKTDHLKGGEEKPTWSNPDPYFIIPPVDESRGKRKDVVQLIRKAKVDTEKAAAEANAVTKNADFISFDDDDEEEEEESNPASAEVAREATQVIVLSEEGEVASGSDEDGSHEPALELHTSLNSTNFTSNTKTSTQNSFSHMKNLHNMGSGTSIGLLDSQTPPPIIQEAQSLLKEVGALPSKPAAALPPKPAGALRNGKRHIIVIDDDDEPEPIHGTKRKYAAAGEITASWAAVSREKSTPWYTDHSATPSMGFWLHKEICDFYDYIKPKPYEDKIRQNLIDRVQNCLSKMSPGCKVMSFGSYGQGIYLPTSDMDLVMLSNNFLRSGNPTLGKHTVHKVANELQRAGIADRKDITPIKSARVPIVKFVDKMTGIHCDISFDNQSGLQALTTFDRWRTEFPFLPALLSVLKQWLLMRGMNEVFSGGLGGFSLTCMVVSMLQMKPQIKSGNLGASGQLGEQLMEFFNLYGNEFRMAETGITFDPPGYFSKAVWGIGKPNRWTIIDPNKDDNDLSGGSSSAPLIAQKFAESFKLINDLQVRLRVAGPVLRRGQSFLRLIIGGNYAQVERQRDLLRLVHERLFGPIPG